MPFSRPPRPANNASQAESKTTSLADFSDEKIFEELRRRGYVGKLQLTKTVNV